MFNIKWKKHDKHNITYEAENPYHAKKVKDTNKTELKGKDTRLLTQDNAEEFSVKHKGWIYQIPDYKAGNMTKNFLNYWKLNQSLEGVK